MSTWAWKRLLFTTPMSDSAPATYPRMSCAWGQEQTSGIPTQHWFQKTWQRSSIRWVDYLPSLDSSDLSSLLVSWNVMVIWARKTYKIEMNKPQHLCPKILFSCIKSMYFEWGSNAGLVANKQHFSKTSIKIGSHSHMIWSQNGATLYLVLTPLKYIHHYFKSLAYWKL